MLLHRQEPDSFEEEREYDKASAEYETALRLDPERAEYRTMRGSLWIAPNEPKGTDGPQRGDQAGAERRRCLSQCSIVWRNTGELDKALGDLAEATRLDPGKSDDLMARAVVWEFVASWTRH